MDVLSAGLSRFAEATPVKVQGSWWVTAPGDGEGVLPRGVQPDDYFDPEPAPLHETLHEVYEDLSLVAVLDPERAAEHLAQHVRRFGLPELCSHGLPLLHNNRDRRGPSTGVGCGEWQTPDGRRGVRVDHVAAMVTALDAVGKVYERLAKHRTMPGPAMTEDLLSWPVQRPDMLSAWSGVHQQESTVAMAMLRRLVLHTLDQALRTSGGHIGPAWPKQRRPELVLYAETSVALYVADTMWHVGFITPDRTLVCDLCSQPFTPKRAPRAGDGTYCRRPECQRERTRRNVARSRARGKD